MPTVENAQFRVDIQERILNPIRVGGTASDTAVVIGSAPALLIEAIDKDLADAKQKGEVHEIVAFDAPRRALRKIIAENAHEMVGGSVQQAQATSSGFQIIAGRHYKDVAIFRYSSSVNARHVRVRMFPCAAVVIASFTTYAFSKPYPLENYVIPGLSDILKFMKGWVQVS